MSDANLIEQMALMKHMRMQNDHEDAMKYNYAAAGKVDLWVVYHFIAWLIEQKAVKTHMSRLAGGSK